MKIKIFRIITGFMLLTLTCCSRSYDEPLKIVFQRGNLGVLPANIWVMNEDGTDEKQLTLLDTDFGPSWSSDCSSIVFIRGLDVYKMNTAGSDLQLVVSTGQNCRYPTWSPNGNDILFTSSDAGFQRIFRIKIDGTGMIPLTGVVEDYSSLSWSPDGSKIVMCDGSGPSIYTGNAFAESVPVILVPSTAAESTTWSPDGERILYIDNNQIYITNKDGTGVSPLTSDPWSYSSPVWSPDGKKIAFSSNESGVFQIYIMNSDGSGKRRLTYSNINEDYPCFEGKPR